MPPLPSAAARGVTKDMSAKDARGEESTPPPFNMLHGEALNGNSLFRVSRTKAEESGDNADTDSSDRRRSTQPRDVVMDTAAGGSSAEPTAHELKDAAIGVASPGESSGGSLEELYLASKSPAEQSDGDELQRLHAQFTSMGSTPERGAGGKSHRLMVARGEFASENTVIRADGCGSLRELLATLRQKLQIPEDTEVAIFEESGEDEVTSIDALAASPKIHLRRVPRDA